MDQNNSLETEDSSTNASTEGTSSLENIDSTSTLEGVDATGKIVDKAAEKKKLPFFKRLIHGTNIYLLLYHRNGGVSFQ